MFSLNPGLFSDSEQTSVDSVRTRQGRQQNGDTYTLEIAFPAVKYVDLFGSCVEIWTLFVVADEQCGQ